MNIIKILLFVSAFGANGQNNSTKPLKFEGEIKGVFEVIEIDSTHSANLIHLKLKYLINPDKALNIEIPNSYEAVIFSNKEKPKKNKKGNKTEKLKIGTEYYFELEHYFYYRNLNPPPNSIPYALDLEGERVWQESSDYGIYTTAELKGLYYTK